jgi:hypothetical protein
MARLAALFSMSSISWFWTLFHYSRLLTWPWIEFEVQRAFVVHRNLNDIFARQKREALTSSCCGFGINAADCVGSLDPEDAERMAAMYGRYVKMPERLLLLLKQARTDIT